MTGKGWRATAGVLAKVPNMKQKHCTINREVLFAKHFEQSLFEGLSLCVNIANSIKAPPHQSRTFAMNSVRNIQAFCSIQKFDGYREEKL